MSVPVPNDQQAVPSHVDAERQQIPRSTYDDQQNVKQTSASASASVAATASATTTASVAVADEADDLNNLNNNLSECKLPATTTASDLSSAEDDGHHSTASEAGSELSSSRESSASRTSPARSVPIPVATIETTTESAVAEDARTTVKTTEKSAAATCHSASAGDESKHIETELMGLGLADSNKGDAESGDSAAEILNSLGGEPMPVPYLANIYPADANANSALNYESAETNSENVSEAGAVVGSLHSAHVSASPSPGELSSPEDQQAAPDEHMSSSSSFRALGASTSSAALSLQQQHSQTAPPVPFACTASATCASICDPFAQECDLEKDLQIRADAIRLAMEPLAPLDTCCCSSSSSSPLTQRANSDSSSPAICSNVVKSGAIARNSRKGKPRTAQRLAEEEVHTSLEDVLRQFVSLEVLSGTAS